MKIVKGLFAFVFALVAVVVAIGFFLPKTAHVERSITTSASPQAIYEVVRGFRRFNEWSPWASLDKKTRYRFSGPESGVGARMEWQSDDPNVGSGSQEIVAVEPGRSVTIQLDFGEHGKPRSTMTLNPDGGGTRIVWSMDMDFDDNFVDRYFGPFLDSMVGTDYEKGLAQLKRLVEVTPPANAPLISARGPADARTAAVNPD